MDTIALAGAILCCPDCNSTLSASLSCERCGRSFQPDEDGIISALPRHMTAGEQTPEQVQQIIQAAGEGDHGSNIVLYEKAFHDEQASYYDEMFADPQPLASYYKHLVRSQIYAHVKRQPFVVDLCCGTGKSSMPLLEQGVRIVGIDVSRRMLQYYRKKWPSSELLLIHADASCPPLRTQSCGAIIMIGGLHHIQDQQGCIDRCCAALSADGVLLLHEPLKTGKHSRMAVLLQNLYALADAKRVSAAIRRRLGFGPVHAVAQPVNEHLDFTPYEKPFSAPAELAALMPSSMKTLHLRSQGAISFHDFPRPFQRGATESLAKLVVKLDHFLSSRSDDGSGDALFAVYQKNPAKENGPALGRPASA